MAPPPPPPPTHVITAELVIEECKKVINQNAFNIFQPTHIVEVDYPCFSLLRPGEQFYLFPADHQDERYDPSEPPVPDFSATKHTSKDSLQENLSVSHYAVLVDSIYPDIPYLELGQGQGSRADAVKAAMDYVIQHVGLTKLGVISFVDPAKYGEEQVLLRISIEASFAGEGDLHAQVWKAHYVTRMESFNGTFKHYHRKWRVSLEALLNRATPRAARYVRKKVDDFAALDASGRARKKFEQGNLAWLPKREMDYESLLWGLVRTSTGSRSRQCEYCSEDPRTPGHAPVALPCAIQGHVMCPSCLVKLCETHGADKAACPQCHKRFFDRRQTELLISNLIHGTNEYEPRFEDTENFQRTCADIDMYPASSSDSMIKIDNPPMVFHIWVALFTRNEPKWTIYPEYRTLMIGLEKAIRELPDRELPMKAVYNVLSSGIWRALTKAMFDSGVDRYFSDTQLKALMKQPQDNRILRAGFKHAVERSLHRLLRFLQMRRCDCKGAKDSLHFKKARLFYHPELFERELSLGNRGYLKISLDNVLQKAEDKYRRGSVQSALVGSPRTPPGRRSRSARIERPAGSPKKSKRWAAAEAFLDRTQRKGIWGILGLDPQDTIGELLRQRKEGGTTVTRA